MKETYYLYWELADGSIVYHLDTDTAKAKVFYTYQDLFTAGQRLPKPTIDSITSYGVVKL